MIFKQITFNKDTERFKVKRRGKEYVIKKTYTNQKEAGIATLIPELLEKSIIRD